jgi:elongation factor G
LGGSGELHLEIVIDRLAREFNVEASVGRPRIAYKEALTQPASGEMKYATRIDGRNHYAHVKLDLYPADGRSTYVFQNDITGGSIPTEFIASVDAGVREALAGGVVAGHPVEGVRVRLWDGSYHDRDSSNEAFRIAGFHAALDAARNAAPVVLEPVMLGEVTVPEEHADEIVDSLISRRGQIDLRENRNGTIVIHARVPLAGLFGYASDLRMRTFGRGAFTTRFFSYRPCDIVGRSDDAGDSIVGAPLKPRPGLRDSGVALPEPDDDRPDDDQMDQSNRR